MTTCRALLEAVLSYIWQFDVCGLCSPMKSNELLTIDGRLEMSGGDNKSKSAAESA